MLAKDIKDKFLNTYFHEDKKYYITELYDKWRRNPPELLKISHSKDEAEKNHYEILKGLEAKSGSNQKSLIFEIAGEQWA